MGFRKLFVKLFSYWFKHDDVFQKMVLRLFSDSSFYLQGQMDINPKGKWYNKEFVNKTGGYFICNDDIPRTITEFDDWDNTRKDMIILLLRQLLLYKISGSLAEIGVYKGLTAKLIHYYLPERKFYLFDTFEGFSYGDLNFEKQRTGLQARKEWFNDTSVEGVLNYIKPLNNNIIVKEGHFPDTVDKIIKDEEFAFVHLDADLYNPTKEGLEFFYPRLVGGGVILVHDYMSWQGAHDAVNDFCTNLPFKPITMPDKNGSALIIKV
jgi:O-methyltransferase